MKRLGDVVDEISREFDTRMKILSVMISCQHPLAPKEISERTGITHYPTITYHLKKLIKEGVVIPLDNNRNQFCLQPFMVDRAIDGELEDVIETAFRRHYTKHLTDDPDDYRLFVESFSNAFLYYVKYLLSTGDFQVQEE